MKFFLPTLLLTTLATATPSSPLTGASVNQHNETLAPRAAHAYTDAHSHFAARSSNKRVKGKKTTKPKGGHSGSGNGTESAAVMRFVPSMGTLQMGVVGVGVLEVVRLWG